MQDLTLTPIKFHLVSSAYHELVKTFLSFSSAIRHTQYPFQLGVTHQIDMMPSVPSFKTDKKIRTGCNQRQSSQESLVNIPPHNLGTPSTSYNSTKRWKSPCFPSYPQGQHESFWKRLQRSPSSHLSYFPDRPVKFIITLSRKEIKFFWDPDRRIPCLFFLAHTPPL